VFFVIASLVFLCLRVDCSPLLCSLAVQCLRSKVMLIYSHRTCCFNLYFNKKRTRMQQRGRA
jgi:hypothetical protein